MKGFCAVLAAAGLAAGAANAPNVLILLTDDQGWGDQEHNCENSTGLCAHMPNLAQLARSQHSAHFHRFYAAASVCSPTRAAILTGRTNNRDCIDGALPCCQEDPAPTCSMGKNGALPWTEFTVAKAAKASKLGDYATIFLGKWHLGDLWNKRLPGQHNLPGATVSSPGNAGFDEWLST
jgi:arylsulfatase A-like enzyme